MKRSRRMLLTAAMGTAAMGLSAMGCAANERAPKLAGDVEPLAQGERAVAVAAAVVHSEVESAVERAVESAVEEVAAVEPMPETIACRVGNTKPPPELRAAPPCDPVSEAAVAP